MPGTARSLSRERCSPRASCFINDTAPPELYTLSLHDALPISVAIVGASITAGVGAEDPAGSWAALRSEEHTSELQSHVNLVCRLLLEKKKRIKRRGSMRAKSGSVAKSNEGQSHHARTTSPVHL